MPCRACTVIAAVRICGAMDGRPFAETHVREHLRRKQPATVLGQVPDTLPAGINSRHVAHASGPTVSPTHP